MRASEKIVHKGKVVSVSQDEVLVSILSESACVSCQAKSACTMMGAKEKTITVPKPATDFQQGEEVHVTIRRSLALNAVWWAYVFPLLLFLIILLPSSNIFVSEGLSALLAISSLALYYILLRRFRDKLKKNFVFEIEKLNYK